MESELTLVKYWLKYLVTTRPDVIWTIQCKSQSKSIGKVKHIARLLSNVLELAFLHQLDVLILMFILNFRKC